MSEPRHTVILDWDGTLVPSAWPEQPREFMPGAVESVLAMHHAGLKLTVNTARMNPFDPFTGERFQLAKVVAEKNYIRDTLDRMGLTFVNIWDLPGKPSGSAYVDDKAYRYTGSKGAWKATANTVIMHLSKQEPPFPAFPHSLVEA